MTDVDIFVDLPGDKAFVLALELLDRSVSAEDYRRNVADVTAFLNGFDWEEWE